MRSFLGYYENVLRIQTLSPKLIRPPRLPRREVVFLSKDEVERFINTIDVEVWHEFRLRVLVEAILGSGARIGELLSLNNKDIDWGKKEAKIIGKGNKERRIFFTDRAPYWIKRFLDSRSDDHEEIFITRDATSRLNRDDIWRFFDRHRRLARIEKRVTPHILRHTVATNLIFNGCPIVHVKEILGHEMLDTTCRYYLGVDKEEAKKAHRSYLRFLDRK